MNEIDFRRAQALLDLDVLDDDLYDEARAYTSRNARTLDDEHYLMDVLGIL